MQQSELGILLHQAVEGRLGRILQLAAREGWLEDVEAVHDVRVASRRLRAALDLAGPDLPPAYRRLRRRAKALTAALGATRELDVHVQRLEGLGPRLAGPAAQGLLEHLLESFDRERRKARARMFRAVERIRIAEWSAFPGTLDRGEDPEPQDALRTLLGPRLEAVLAGIQARLLVHDPAGLHRLRIDTKKLRYALETLGAALPAAAEIWLGRLKALQGALGDHHDWVVLEAELWNHHALLVDHLRPALAAGTLELLGLVVECRQKAFEALPAAAEGLDPLRALAELCPADEGRVP